MTRRLPLLMVLLPLAACDLPRDPEGTSERMARSHELRVGATADPPWAILANGQARGIEPALVEAFAAQHGARVVWTPGSESKLVEQLGRYELDIVIGGVTSQTPWKTKAGVSAPFATAADHKRHVFLTAPGENKLALALDRFLVAHKRAAQSAQS